MFGFQCLRFRVRQAQAIPQPIFFLIERALDLARVPFLVQRIA